MGNPTRIVERISLNALAGVRAEDIDEANGVIRNVAICGETSENGRKYPTEVMSRDFKKYEGAAVNFDHLDETPGAARKFEDRGGWLSDVHTGSDGRPRATLNVLKSDARSPKVFELAKRNSRAFGLSHVAYCKTRFENNIEIVESIESIESVDIVADPATNKGLFEGKTQGKSTVSKISLKKFGERFGPKWGPKKWGDFTKLCEDMGSTYADAAMVSEPAAEVETPDLKTALMEALSPLLDEAFESGDATKAAAAVKDFVKLHSKHTGKSDAGGSTEASTDAAEESRKQAATAEATAFREAHALCESMGFFPPAADLGIVARTPHTERKGVAERLKKLAEAGASAPISQGRDQLGGAAPTQAKESKTNSAPKLTEGSPYYE